jgi:hypothetical protein
MFAQGTGDAGPQMYCYYLDGLLAVNAPMMELGDYKFTVTAMHEDGIRDVDASTVITVTDLPMITVRLDKDKTNNVPTMPKWSPYKDVVFKGTIIRPEGTPDGRKTYR